MIGCIAVFCFVNIACAVECGNECLKDKKEGFIKLENKFETNKDYYKSSKFKEIDARREFIDKFFDILDWNVSNNSENEVAPETRMKLGYTTKYADYGFREDGRARFYVEAKAIDKDISEPKYVFQAKRYGWSSTSTDIAILTDYEDFCVYDVRRKPEIDKADDGKIFCLNYKDYKDNVEFLYNNFSKEAVLKNNSLQNILKEQDEKIIKKKGTKQQQNSAMDFTKNFLNDFDYYRLLIADDLYKNNKDKDFTEKELNQNTNDILNMLLFSRILEDRDIETTGLLREVAERYELGGNISLTGKEQVNTSERYKPAKTLYLELQKEFLRLSKKYQGIIFKEQTNEIYNLKLSDKTLKKIIDELYLPKSPYNFKAISIATIGELHEQYLAKVIKINKNSIEINNKPEVRESGGVFYTPEWIIDYILNETLNKKLKDIKTPEELKQLKILDPACGSGAFPVKATERLFQWTINYYLQNPNKIIKDKDNFNSIEKLNNENYKLSPNIKRDIIENNIFCVDIDKQAINNTKMWLYIKILEDESSIVNQKGRKKLDHYNNEITTNFTLPSLENNILNQNTLKTQFNKKYDIIITNPPYISTSNMNKYLQVDLKYYRENYKSMSSGKVDLYFAFIELGINLLKEDGYLGYITSSAFLYNDSGSNIRKIIAKTNSLDQLIDFGSNKIFNEVQVPTAILILNKNNKNSQNFKYIKANNKVDPEEIIKKFDKQEKETNDYFIRSTNKEKLGKSSWNFNQKSNDDIIKSIERQKVKLGDISKISSGIITGNDKIYLIEAIEEKNNKILFYSKIKEKKYWIEKDMLNKFFKCEKIKSYCKSTNKYFTIYPYKNGDKLLTKQELKEKFPLNYLYFEENNLLESFKYSKKSNIELDYKEKIITGWASGYGKFTIDADLMFFTGSTKKLGIVIQNKNYSTYAILGILNSKYLSNYLHSVGQILGGAYYYKSSVLKQIPIPELTEKTKPIYGQLDKLVKDRLNTEIVEQQENIERKIEKLVNQIYK